MTKNAKTAKIANMSKIYAKAKSDNVAKWPK